VKSETVGLIGVGRFGRMVVRHLRDRVRLRIFDADPERTSGMEEAASLEEVCAAREIVLCVPISRVDQVCRTIASRLGPEQTVIDTCSVKTRPVEWMTAALPESAGILGTHPLFGPDSGKDGIAGLKIALCPVRIDSDRYGRICEFLRSLELVLVETTPEEHDRQIALSQAIFHLIAQAVQRLEWGVKPISTPGPEAFYRLVRSVQRDTRQLFLDMERENPFAAECRRQFIDEIHRLDRELRSRCGGGTDDA
jgi:prephenate dehydrogenase